MDIKNNNTIDIFFSEEEQKLIDDLSLEIVKILKDDKLVIDKDDLEIFNISGIF